MGVLMIFTDSGEGTVKKGTQDPVKNDAGIGDRLRFEQMISDLSARFIHVPSRQLDEQIERALKRVLEFFQVDRCGLLHILPDQDAWEITHAVYSENTSPIPIGTVMPRSINPWAFKQLADKGQIVAFARVAEIPDEARVDKETWRDWGIRSNLVIPVFTGERVVYVIAINSVEKERAWPKAFIPRLQLLGEIFVNALERRKFEQALRDSEEQLNLAASAAEAGLWVIYPDMGRLWATPKLREIFRFSPDEELSFDRFLETVHPEDRNSARETLDLCLRSRELVIFEYRILLPDGRVRWVVARGRSFPGTPEQPERVMGATVDITERKEMETRLKDQLAEIRRLKDQLEQENLYLRDEIELEKGHEGIIAQDKAMKQVMAQVDQVAGTDATVLILGETGTGKGLIANAIHQASHRKGRPLVTVNCAALPQNLIESELFGREKGAFTGAHARQAGRFEVADKGTIFLDEIGEMPLELQSKLLRVLQEGEFERLGSAKTIKVDVRMIAATSRDLRQEVRSGRFREDLFYRLYVFPIAIPPLRQRAEDIPLLARHFTKRCARKMSRQIDHIPNSMISELMQYDWPGNVRELEHVIERSVIVSSGPSLALACELKPVGSGPMKSEPLKDLSGAERDHILRALRETGWRIEGSSGAAAILKLNPSTLRFRIKKLGIRRPIR